ncbi:MAG: hypothetical protein ACJAZX_001022 [Rickettsiales bacterium]|jgi:hypothetical protein
MSQSQINLDPALQKCTKIFYAFLFSHVFLWTILPLIFRFNPHLDTLEAVALGSEWQLGYFKHPPLSNWLAHFSVEILGKSSWVLYFLSQVCVGMAMVAVWKLAKLFLPIRQALMATILLEGVYYYNFTSIEFNTNILMMALWAWAILYAWKSLDKNKILDWSILGALLGLGIITKYHTVLLAGAIFLMMIYEKDFRQRLATIKPYFAILSGVVVLAGHVIWMIQNNFPSIQYAVDRSVSDHHYYNHLIHPLSFSLAQMAAMGFALVTFFVAFGFKKGDFFLKNTAPAAPLAGNKDILLKNGELSPPRLAGNKDILLKNGELSPPRLAGNPIDTLKDRRIGVFLFFMVFVPFLLTILPSLLTGSKIRDMWGTTLWNLCGVYLFYYFKPQISKKNIRKFTIGIFVAIAISTAAYSGAYVASELNLITSKKVNKRTFNGELLAKTINQKWNKHYEEPLEIVVCEIWLCGNAHFFSKNSSPSIFLDMDETQSMWLSLEELKNKGGIIIWDAEKEGGNLPERFKDKITNPIKILEPINIAPHIFSKNSHNFQLGWALVLKQE